MLSRVGGDDVWVVELAVGALVVFFFQAEDGIRDSSVTGVQTCALPISAYLIMAMATMDIIKYAGGSPANFLDVGGGASAEQVKNAFRILLSDKHVKAVLINIFGGILRCDTLATGVVAAARDLNIQVPIVVRMEGTNVELGRQILLDSGFNFTVGQDMLDAARKVVKLAA